MNRYRGVCWHKSSKTWTAMIKINNKNSTLGYFKDEIEAAQRYDEAAGPLGRPVNFPDFGDGVSAAVSSFHRPPQHIYDRIDSTATAEKAAEPANVFEVNQLVKEPSDAPIPDLGFDDRPHG